MREIIFDTETTGLDNLNDRVIEIGAIELIDRYPTGKTFHVYINPEGRAVHPDALAVHGIENEFLKDKPVMAQIVEDFLVFVGDGHLVAHNAKFDMGFMNAEFARLSLAPFPDDRVIDTLVLAKQKHPLAQNSLDALCRRYGIDNSHRTKHGALLDSELLAEVYIELKSAKQASFGLEQTDRRQNIGAQDGTDDIEVLPRLERTQKLDARLSLKEHEAHLKLIDKIGEHALWAKYLAEPSSKVRN